MAMGTSEQFNFDQAVQAHSMWKQKLASYLHKPNGQLKVQDVSSDCLCPLGQWIQGQGAATHAHLPEFVTLRSDHTRFHVEAGKVVARADKGEHVAEEVLLGAKSEFADASASVVSAILKLKKKLA